MAPKPTTTNSTAKGRNNKRKTGSKNQTCEHIVYGALLAAKDEHKFEWEEVFTDASRNGNAETLLESFHQLKAISETGRAKRLEGNAKKAVDEIISFIKREKKVDVSLLEALANGETSIQTCEHIVYVALMAAKDEHGFQWGEVFGEIGAKGEGNSPFRTFQRLKETTKAERTKSLEGIAARDPVGKIIDYIEREKNVDVSLLRALANGKTSIKADAVDSYVRHVVRRVREAKNDPIRKRVALEAKARAHELEHNWPQAAQTLEAIVDIEAASLCDPVEAARTSTRAAEAYIDCVDPKQYPHAERVLESAKKGLSNMPNVVRTKLELLLAQAHLKLKQGRGHYEDGINILKGPCAQLLKELGADKNPSKYFLKLVADFHVRLGALMKRTAKTDEAATEARMHLLKGAIARANLKAPLNLAHAVRHVRGGFWRPVEIQTKVFTPSGPSSESEPEPTVPELPPEKAFAKLSLEEFDRVKTLLLSSLWFYCSALVIFENEKDQAPQARNHLHCGNIHTLLAVLCHTDTDETQKQHLQNFGTNTRNELRAIPDAATLVTLLTSMGFEPANSGQNYFERPFAEAARLHFEQCIRLANKHEELHLKQEGQTGIQSLDKSLKAVKRPSNRNHSGKARNPTGRTT